MEVMSVRVASETRERMSKLSDINWAEVIREAVEERIALEESLRSPIDRRRAARAASSMDRLRQSLQSSDYRSTDEVRRWRDSRR